MFRSLGEFTTCASRVYDHFANLAAPGTPAGSLDRDSCREAFYALFGYRPAPTFFSTLFREELDGDGQPSCCPSATVDRDGFLQFTQLVARSEGYVVTKGDGGVRSEEEEGDGTPTRAVPVGHSWPMFVALADEKDYISWDDFRSAGASLSLSSAVPALWLTDGSRAAEEDDGRVKSDFFPVQTPGDVRRHERLLSHVFSLLDSDHDGRLTYADVRRYLEGRCC